MQSRLVVGSVLAVAALTALVVGQESRTGESGAGDWPTHNRDLHSTRFSPLTQVNVSNVSKLAVKWSVDQPGITEQTPIVVNGIMYIGLGSKVVALNAATGAAMWTSDIPPTTPGGRRGPAYGEGKVYSNTVDTVYAMDAKTGKPVETFGDHGALHIINKALAFKYPGKYPADLQPNTLGWALAAPPRIYDNTIIVGTSDSDSIIAGGLVIAANATTGAIKWVFTTVPQGPQDEGWEIAKDTWSSSYRPGGGVWTQAAIDPDLRLVYFDVANAAPDYDGSARHGTNLFTDSTVALRFDTGKLVWHFQTVHHDVWDKDAIAGPVLFDVTIDGKTVKAIGTGGKTCLAYFWNRETGQPLNPIVETPVPNKTDNPNEQLWPTQPIPYSARGVPSTPFCATYPIIKDPELAKRARPMFSPWLVNEMTIASPGLMGGANFGAPSYSPRTGFFYVTGKNDAWSIQLNPVGDRLRPAAGSRGHFDLIKQEGKTGMVATTNVGAYDPATGQLMWAATIPAATNGGNLVTAGDVVFQGGATGDFFAFDAKTGKQLLQYRTGKNGVRASPLAYAVGGKEFVAVVGGSSILAFTLP